jgi:hypothetical protein
MAMRFFYRLQLVEFYNWWTAPAPAHAAAPLQQEVELNKNGGQKAIP